MNGREERSVPAVRGPEAPPTDGAPGSRGLREHIVELGPLWDRVWARRTGIAALVVAATILTGVVAFLMPNWYRAQATLLPPSAEESGVGLGSLLREIGLVGVKVPTEATPADVFVAILDSRRLLDEMIRQFDLQHRYRVRYLSDAEKELRGHSRFKVSEAGFIQVSVEDRDPKQAAAMTNAYVDLLDRFNREMRMTRGRRVRMFVESRLEKTRTELDAAEQRLTDYQAQHKTVILSREMSSAMDAAARLYAERAALQVRLGVARSYTRGESDAITQMTGQLAELDRQLRALPETGLELARLYRDVRTLEQVYVLLTGQYEEARIDEARDTPTVEVLDRAVPPEKKARPHRGVLMAVAFLLSLGVGTSYAVLAGGGRLAASARAT